VVLMGRRDRPNPGKPQFTESKAVPRRIVELL